MKQDIQKQLLNEFMDTNSISKLQEYIREILKIRGISNNTIHEEIIMLMEEVGELAKSVRKNVVNMSIDHNRVDSYDTVENEVVDVLIVLIGICNILNIDLQNEFKKKESMNVNRKWG